MILLGTSRKGLAGFPNPSSVSSSDYSEAIKGIPRLKNIYASNYDGHNTGLDFEDSLLENLIAKVALNNAAVRHLVAIHELPALALFYGPAKSKDIWAKAINTSGDFILWTNSKSLLNGVIRALKSKITSDSQLMFLDKDNYVPGAKNNDLVLPVTRLEILQNLQKVTLPSEWRDKLIEAIKAQDAVLAEQHLSTAERKALSSVYKDTVSVLEQKRAEEAFQNIPSLPPPTLVVPEVAANKPAIFKNKNWKTWAILGAGGLAILLILVSLNKQYKDISNY